MESGPSFAALPEYPPPAEQPVVRYAGWGYRVAAFVTDAGIALAVATLAGLALGGDDVGTRETVVGLGVVAVWILVTSVAMGVFEGQTVGKRLTGTRVVLGDRPVGFGLSLLRDQVLRILYLVPLFFLVDSIWAAADKQSQTLRDKMVGTHVVHAGATPARGAVAGALATVLLVAWVALSVIRDEGSSGSLQPGYTDVERQAFVESCQGEGAAESYCTCLFDYISERVPYDTFASITSEDISEWPAPMREATTAGIEQCS
jgi:uncharacterized RDD family membrane protein YckC